MSTPKKQISPERQAAYYGGMCLIGLGFLLFISNFFLGPKIPHNLPNPGDANFWPQAQEQHQKFADDMEESSVRAVAGIVLIILGAGLMGIGSMGAAGSGLVLNPEQARKDLEPWNKLKGGMVQDALSEINVVKKIEEGMSAPPPEIKIRCRKCQALNDETAKFCNQCGASL